MHKRFAAVSALTLVLSLAMALAGWSMPASFLDPVDGQSGWLSIGLRYFIPAAGKDHPIGFEFTGAGPQRFGIGLEIGGSGVGRGIMFAVSGLYYLDPVPSEYFTLPIKLRLGGMVAASAANWFTSLSCGALFFSPRYRYDDPADPKELGLTAGADGELYYFNGKFYPALSLSGAGVLRLGPNTDTGNYYYISY
jgi:hypothetical protein